MLSALSCYLTRNSTSTVSGHHHLHCCQPLATAAVSTDCCRPDCSGSNYSFTYFNYNTLNFEYYLLLRLPGVCIVAGVAAWRGPPELVSVSVESCESASVPSVVCVALVIVYRSVRSVQTIVRIIPTIVVAIVQCEPGHLISHD